MAFAREVYEPSSNNQYGTGNLDYPITFPYIAKSHIKVAVNGTNTTAYDFIDASNIRLQSATHNIAIGDKIVITRETSPSARLVDYQTGSVLSEEILDQDSLQGFFLAQEANDIKEVALARDNSNNWDALNSRIVNVADAVNNTDAVNKQSVTAITGGAVTAAQTAAGQAQNAEQAASADAALALGYRQDALGYRNDANTAKTDAETAKTDAESALASSIAALNAANIPSSLSGQGNKFLQVNTGGTAYNLVSSVAAPVFYGLKINGGSLDLTSTRTANVAVKDFDNWLLSENITISISNNDLQITL